MKQTKAQALKKLRSDFDEKYKALLKTHKSFTGAGMKAFISLFLKYHIACDKIKARYE